MFVTVAVGLWGGLLIGLQTEYFTSNRYQPVQVRASGSTAAPPASARAACLHERLRSMLARRAALCCCAHTRLCRASVPAQDVADSCRTGAATNVIFGLALGYKSCIIPTIAMAVAIYTGNSLAGMYGIATAALGMLGTLATGEHGVRARVHAHVSVRTREPQGTRQGMGCVWACELGTAPSSARACCARATRRPCH